MQQILNVIHTNSNFVLAGHVSPDGDTIGACYALAFALKQMGKNVTVAIEAYPKKYDIMPGREFLNTAPQKDLNVDVLIALDCADIKRLGPGLSLFKRAKTTVCIDHHKTNSGFAKVNYIMPNASSTCEIIYRLLQKLPITLCQSIATAIYVGLVTDTGGFRHKTTSPYTMEVAAKMMATGIPFTEIYAQVLLMHSFAASNAKGTVLANAKQVQDNRIVYSYISREALATLGADSADLDGVIDYLLSTAEAEIAMLAYETKLLNQVKISFRSKGPDVGNVAAALGGGGHHLAAGCTVPGDIENAIAKALPLAMEALV